MAKTASITKRRITCLHNKVFEVSVTMDFYDNGDKLYSAQVTSKFNAKTETMADLKLDLMTKIKAKWDAFAAENIIFAPDAFNTIVGEIETSAMNYINQ